MASIASAAAPMAANTPTLKKKQSWIGSIREVVHQSALGAKAVVDSLRGYKEVPEEEAYATSTPRTSVDSAVSIHHTPQSKHKHGTPRKSLTPKSAVSSLRSHLHRHHNSKRSRRGSIGNVFSRHTSNKSASVAGARGPETFERTSHDTHRTSVSGGRKSMTMTEPTLIPLPSSPIAIPTEPPLALKLDLGPPVALSPFAEMGEAAKRWEAQVLHGNPSVSTRLFDRESPGRPLPKTPLSLDLVGMVPLALRTSEGGKTPGQGRLLMTPTPLEPDDPFADIPTPMPGTSQTLELDEYDRHQTGRDVGSAECVHPATPATSADTRESKLTLEPDDPFSHLQAGDVSFGIASSSISSLKLSSYEIGSICSGRPASTAHEHDSDNDFDASALSLALTSEGKIVSEQGSDASSNASVRGSSPADSDLKTTTDETDLWVKTPSHGPPSPTRKVHLPIRSAPIKQPVIHEPEVGVVRQLKDKASSLTVQQKYFPSTSGGVASATPQSADRREDSLDTTSSTVSSSSFHHSILSPMSSSVCDEAVQELPPLSRCKSNTHSPTPAGPQATDENSSPLRTPSMGDKVAFDLQCSERNARYNSIYSGQFNKIVHYDTEIQLPDYDNAGGDSQRTTPRSTDNEGSEEDGGVRLDVEASIAGVSDEPVHIRPSAGIPGNSGLTPKRLRFASRVPSASADSAAPTTTTTCSEARAIASDIESVASNSSVDS